MRVSFIGSVTVTIASRLISIGAEAKWRFVCGGVLGAHMALG